MKALLLPDKPYISAGHHNNNILPRRAGEYPLSPAKIIMREYVPRIKPEKRQMNIDIQEFIEAFCSELNADKSKINPETPLDKIPEWDSLGMVRFLLTCDEKFGIQLPAAEASEATTVEDLKQKVEKASGNT